MRSTPTHSRSFDAGILLLLLCILCGCGDGSGGTSPVEDEVADPIPCFPDAGRPVWRIAGVEVTDAAVNRLAAQVRLQSPGISEKYSRMKAMEKAILVQSLAYARAGEEKVRDASRRIRAVMTRLRAGEDFAAVARSASDDLTSREAGGSVDWVSRAVTGNQRAMTPSFEWVLFQTPVGEFSEPFASPFGFHVLFVHEERPSELGEGLTDRRTSQILCSFHGQEQGDREFLQKFQKALRKDSQRVKVEILDEAWRGYVPGIYLDG